MILIAGEVGIGRLSHCGPSQGSHSDWIIAIGYCSEFRPTRVAGSEP
jgi:hypothetical protein